MKKFLAKLLIFFAIFTLIDIVLGSTLLFCAEHAKGGDTSRQNYIINETNILNLYNIQEFFLFKIKFFNSYSKKI